MNSRSTSGYTTRMLTPWDDYPIHADADPVATPSSANPNHYDRYFFNGHERDGAFYIGGAMGHYPVLGVIDAAFSIVIDGDRALGLRVRAHAARPLHERRADPHRRRRADARAALHGRSQRLSAHVRPHVARPHRRRRGAAPAQRHARRHRHQRAHAPHAVGYVGGHGHGRRPAGRHRPDPRVFGTRDRSWGMRGLSTPIPTNRPNYGGGAFWLWAPLYFDDLCTHLALHEYPNGKRWVESTLFVPLLGGADAPTWGIGVDNSTEMIDVQLRARLLSGVAPDPLRRVPPRRSRRRRSTRSTSRRCTRSACAASGTRIPSSVTVRSTASSRSVTNRSSSTTSPTPTPPRGTCRTSSSRAMEGRTGIGVLEQALIGPHEPTGLTGFLDPAPAKA